MISIDFFGCKEEQIVTCSWADACERFPCTGIVIPDWSALNSLSEALSGTPTFSAERVPRSIERFYEFDKVLTSVIRQASTDDLKDAGARWAKLPPWSKLDVNSMDLAGFLLHLNYLVDCPGNDENGIFLWVE